jgi:hypothetical protein
MITVYTNHGAVVGNYNAVRAAHLLDIEVEDLVWAIENFGRADSIDGVAIPFGVPYEPYDEWYAKQRVMD